MFDFKTLHLKVRHFVPVIVVVITVLLLVELAFRTADWFYDYEGWESPGLHKKMEKAQELYEEKGRIDLVTLSSSIGRVWDVNQWEEATSGSIVAYNFGFPDQRPERQYFLFKKHIYPNYKPSHVIYGVSAGDTNSNSRGMHPERRKTGPFWTYRRIRELDADTLLQKGIARLEEVSYLFRSRSRARFTLQYGPVWMLEEEPTIGRGVIVPTVRQQPYGPMVKSWALDPLGMPNNVYRDFWIPDEGEIGEILKLHMFCEKHGIKLAVVEFPTSPYAQTNFDDPVENYGRFVNALNYLESKGAWVLPMARDLQLDNTYYEDQDHMNRWGGQVVTDYVYQKVIREWFPDQVLAPTLPSPVQINFSDIVSTATEGIAIGRRETVTDEAEYAAPEQVMITRPVDVPLSTTILPGSYAIELYAGDGSTTAPEMTGEATVELAAISDDGNTQSSMPLDRWINSRIGISYTQAYFPVPTTATLMLRVAGVGERPLILDSAFVRRRLSNLGHGIIVE